MYRETTPWFTAVQVRKERRLAYFCHQTEAANDPSSRSALNDELHAKRSSTLYMLDRTNTQGFFVVLTVYLIYYHYQPHAAGP